MTKESDAPPRPVRNRPPFECIALVLQGGGALGAYQAGVYQALDEADLDPDWISGISIGAFNSAIIAGNPHGARVQKLREFWESITQPYLDWKPPTALQAAAAAQVAASLAPQPSEFWTLASTLIQRSPSIRRAVCSINGLPDASCGTARQAFLRCGR